MNSKTKVIMVQDLSIRPEIDNGDVIWRYMDFPSFYSLLQTKGLFFRRIDKYADEYEGTLPEEIKEFLLKYLAAPPFFNSEFAQSGTEKFINHLKELNTGTLSNSWVANEKEIYAMWKIYLRGSQEGVAIRTTVGNLRKVLNDRPEEFTLAKVSYDIFSWPETEYKTLAAWKTKPYSYECELRALIYDQFTERTIPIETFPKEPLHEIGRTYEVDISKLIDEIHISPFAGSWFYEVVESCINTFIKDFDKRKILSSRIKDK